MCPFAIRLDFSLSFRFVLEARQLSVTAWREILDPLFAGAIGGAPCPGSTPMSSTRRSPFEPTSKRRNGYPSETRVKRGVRVVHGEKELVEKLGRNDLLSVRLRSAVSRTAA